MKLWFCSVWEMSNTEYPAARGGVGCDVSGAVLVQREELIGVGESVLPKC